MGNLLFKLWLLTRPRVIRQLGRQFPPWNEYRIKQTGQIAVILAYAEDGTMRVHVQRDWEPFGYQVFGIKPDDLERI